VAVLAVQALGKENVLGVAMPSQYSLPMSLEDAEILSKNLGTKLEIRPIKFIFSTFSREIASQRSELNSIAQENLQSRLRGTILMTLANNDNALVMTTGNKSELATGYCTLYGDMVGAIAPIGDLYKTQVYELAKFVNRKFSGVIPERSITRAPTAELKANQTDQDTLPPYDILDALLKDYLALSMDLDSLRKKYGNKVKGNAKWVDEVIKRVEINEYKRRQAVPALKVSSKAFGIGRRIPIAKIWDAH
jgi:NAD+ synthase (glutamine-hydrolysing)